MRELFILELIVLVVALISSYLTWGPLTSMEMVMLFGPDRGEQGAENTPEYLEARRKTSWFNESSRLLVLSIICTILLSFYVERIPITDVIRQPLFQFGFTVVVLVVGGWCIYFGPKNFGLVHTGSFTYFSKESFHIYIKPYLAWIPYGICVWGGLALITILVVIESIVQDVILLQSAIDQIKTFTAANLGDFQLTTIALVDLGQEMIVISQKYIISSLLAFIYLFLEQRSNMQFTIRQMSIEWLKIATWVGLIFTLGFSLVYQPREYEVSHGNLQQQLLIFASGQADSEDLGYLIDLQQYLEEHNVEWIVVNTLTGYGNILTLILVGTSLVFWRAYFKDIPLSAVLALLLPQKVKELLDKIADSIKLDLELEDD